jgi:hypothetical protein
MAQRKPDVRAHGHLNSLLSIVLCFVKRRQAEGLVGVLEVSEGDRLLRVPCCKRWATESLSQDLIAQSEPLRVEVQGEDATLGLVSGSVKIPVGQNGQNGVSRYLYQVEYSGLCHRHDSITSRCWPVE